MDILAQEWFLCENKRIKKMANKESGPTTKSAVYERLVDLAVKGAKQEEKGYMLPAIGKVKLVKRPARTGRNPMTGETIKIKAKKVVKVVACKALKDAILG